MCVCVKSVIGWICGVCALLLLLPQTNEMCVRVCVCSHYPCPRLMKCVCVCVCARMRACACVLNWTAVLLCCVQAVSLNDKVYWWLQWDHYLLGSPFIPLQPPRSLQMTCRFGRQMCWYSPTAYPVFLLTLCFHPIPLVYLFTQPTHLFKT